MNRSPTTLNYGKSRRSVGLANAWQLSSMILYHRRASSMRRLVLAAISVLLLAAQFGIAEELDFSQWRNSDGKRIDVIFRPSVPSNLMSTRPVIKVACTESKPCCCDIGGFLACT